MTQQSPDSRRIKVFLSYAHEDKALVEELKKHIAPLERAHRMVVWSEHQILPGEEWDARIGEALRHCDVFVPLVSADFLAFEFIMREELHGAMKRQGPGESIVLPVTLRPTVWQRTLFAKLQVLPRGGRAGDVLGEP